MLSLLSDIIGFGELSCEISRRSFDETRCTSPTTNRHDAICRGIHLTMLKQHSETNFQHGLSVVFIGGKVIRETSHQVSQMEEIKFCRSSCYALITLLRTAEDVAPLMDPNDTLKLNIS